MSDEQCDIKRIQAEPMTGSNSGLLPNAAVSDTSKIRLFKRIFLVFLFFVFCIVGLHVAVSLTLLNSYTKLLAENYSGARYAAMLSQQLSDLSPTVTIDMKKTIDQQVALTVAAERPVNGIFSALLTHSLLGDKYQFPNEVSAKEFIWAARQSNMRGDIGAASIIKERLGKHSISLGANDLNELQGEVAYDDYRTFVFVAGSRLKNSANTEEANNKLISILVPIRKMHEKSQSVLCATNLYRCEINRIRWLVAECNYQREISGSIDGKCIDSVRDIYLENFGYPTRNEVDFDKCIRRFGPQGCATMAQELPYYMEALVIGYGHAKGE
ncbi:MAG: hypothetical protein Q8J96_06125 [Rhodocyclaceae bacterium]|nr:hypothetical protein [Rhodocyclaceae bacterium]